MQIRIVPASVAEMLFAAIKAMSEMEMPCASQSDIPVTDMLYIPKEIDSVSFVFKTFTTWGTKPKVVSEAAINPIISYPFSSNKNLHETGDCSLIKVINSLKRPHH